MDELFSLKRAALLSGLSSAMVDYLCRSGLLLPTGSDIKPGRGRPRLYTFGDLVMLRVLARLLNQGVAVARLKDALNQLRFLHHEITPNSLPGKYLVTDGKNVYFRNESDVLEDLNSGGQTTFAFVMELETVRNSVIEKIESNQTQGIGDARSHGS